MSISDIVKNFRGRFQRGVGLITEPESSDNRIRVEVMDTRVNSAYCNCMRALPVHEFERPAQYYRRWYETYGFRVIGADLVFENEQDLTYFLLKWS